MNKILKTILVIIMIIGILSVSICAPIAALTKIEVENIPQLENVYQEENPAVKEISNIINTYLQKQKDKGYNVDNWEIDFSKLKENDYKIEKCIAFKIKTIKTTIDGKDYIFKDMDSAKQFEKDIQLTCTFDENNIASVAELTSKENIQKEIDNQKEIREEKARKAEEERLKKLKEEQEKEIRLAIASRGGSSRREVRTSSGVPIASYSYISSPYGPRSRGFHTGTDYAAPMGTHVYAWKSGTVNTASWSGSYGNFISISCDDGTEFRVAHLSGYAVSAGQRVSAGELIGYVGSTGNSTGPHAHFEIKINGQFVNPQNYF